MILGKPITVLWRFARSARLGPVSALLLSGIVLMGGLVQGQEATFSITGSAQDTLEVGGYLQLGAVLKDKDGQVLNQTVEWSSSDPSGAGVDSTGLVIGKKSTSGAAPVIISARAGAAKATRSFTVLGPRTEQKSDRRWMTVVILLAALLFWSIVYGYVRFIQNRYYTSVKEQAQMGFASKAISTQNREFPANRGERLEAGAVGLKLKGPEVAVVGKLSEPFKATNSEGQALEVEWRVEPADAATLLEETGSENKVLSHRPGPIKVTAAHRATNLEGRLTVMGVAETAVSSVELPVFGQSYAIVSVVVLLILVALLLSMFDLFNAGVSTLFGSIAGYLFGFQSASGSTPKSPSQATK